MTSLEKEFQVQAALHRHLSLVCLQPPPFSCSCFADPDTLGDPALLALAAAASGVPIALAS